MNIFVSWSDLKSFIDSRQLSPQWLDINDKYHIYAYDGLFSLECQIKKTSPASADQSEFETTYKDSGNKSPISKVAQTLGEDQFDFQGYGVQFTATKNTTTVNDFLLDKAYALRGGTALFLDGATPKDYFSCQVVDVDNVLGYGAGTVIGEYIRKWHVMPGLAMDAEDVSIAKMPVAGLYFRTTYTSDSSATEDVSCVVNLKTYEID